MKKTERIDIRLTKPDKEKCEKVLKSINETRNKKVGYRYLLMEFVNNYLNNNNYGIEIQINELLKDIETDNEQINKIIEKRTEKEIKLKRLKHERNNKTLFHISNYTDKNIINGFNRLKEIVLTSENINNFEDIDKTTFKQMQESFNIKDIELFKKIVKNHFQEWQQEKIINDPTPEPTKQEIIKNISDKMFKRFKANSQPTKNLNEFLNSDYGKQLIKGYLKEHSEIKESEIINYMLETIPEKRQIK